MEKAIAEKKDNRHMKELIGEEGSLFLQVMRDFVDREIMPVRHLIDADSRADFKLVGELQSKLRAMGAGVRSSLPPEYGGMGISSLVSACVFLEELARGDAGLACASGGAGWAMRPAIAGFQQEGNRRILDDFVDKLTGEEMFVCCFAMTEPEGGCNIENIDMHGRGIATTARLEGDEWVINGAKQWPTNSGISELYCVICQTDPSLGDEGIALIYVPVPIEGFTFGGFEDKMGFRSSREGGFWFDNVRVPKEYRAAGPGKDAELLHDNLIYARGFSAGWAVGPAQGAFDEVMKFTQDRLAAGKPIRQHTIAANMLADMAIGIQVGRDCYVNAAYMYDHPEVYGPKISVHNLSRTSIAKVFCCDMAVNVTNKAMELMGSYGYVTDHHVEKYLRDVKIIQLWEGGAQLGRMDVARGYYNYDQFHKNVFYDRIHELRGKATEKARISA